MKLIFASDLNLSILAVAGVGVSALLVALIFLLVVAVGSSIALTAASASTQNLEVERSVCQLHLGIRTEVDRTNVLRKHDRKREEQREEHADAG